MRIVFDQENKRFLAELTQGSQWRNDMDSAKAAGFKTSGPPDWIWYCTKAAVLNKLRDKHKPASGLVLTEVALEKYKKLNETEQQAVELRKQLLVGRRKQKKQSLDPNITGLVELKFNADGYIEAHDLPPVDPKHKMPVFIKPDIYCIVCGDPLYLPFPDYPDICIWCDKLQNST